TNGQSPNDRNKIIEPQTAKLNQGLVICGGAKPKSTSGFFPNANTPRSSCSACENALCQLAYLRSAVAMSCDATSVTFERAKVIGLNPESRSQRNALYCT